MDITQKELNKVLDLHEQWLRGQKGGQQAILRDMNLAAADFSNRNLTGIDLCSSILTGADFTGCVLKEAVLIGSDCSQAIFYEASLVRANLTGMTAHDVSFTDANLSNAVLSHSNLRGARFVETILSYAFLNDCNLDKAYFIDAILYGTSLLQATVEKATFSGTVLSKSNLAEVSMETAIVAKTSLDPKLHTQLRQFCKECPPLRTGGRIVYRTHRSPVIGFTTYKPGHTYTAPVLSFSAETDCHPGIYAGSLQWVTSAYPCFPIVECYVRDGDWTITAKGAIRCKKLRVLRVLDKETVEKMLRS